MARATREGRHFIVVKTQWYRMGVVRRGEKAKVYSSGVLICSESFVLMSLGDTAVGVACL